MLSSRQARQRSVLMAVLVELRESLGFKLPEVALAGGWSISDLSRIERSEDLEVDDALRLSELYGVDVPRVLIVGRWRPKDAPLGALLKGNASTITADARFAITAAVCAARDVRALERELGVEGGRRVTEFREDVDLRHPDSGVASRLAEKVRAKLALPTIIGSVFDDVLRVLNVFVVGARFRDRAVDAVSSWSQETGAILVVNYDSPRCAAPFALRATLAHEVCHLLFDRQKMRDLQVFCEIDRPERSRWPREAQPIERRARAFQVELLAPQSQVLGLWRQLGEPQDPACIRTLSQRFGLGAEAIAWQLRNAGGADFTRQLPLAIADQTVWKECSTIAPSIRHVEIPEARRGYLLELVRLGVTQGKLSGSWGRELLRLDVPTWDRLCREWASS